MTRRARAIVTVAAGLGGNVELTLPQIDGQLHYPVRIQVVVDPIVSGEDVVCSLNHRRDPSVASSSLDVFDDVGVWAIFGMSEQANHFRQYTSREFPLGGPQTFRVWNGGAATKNFVVIMEYETRKVNVIQWANEVVRTSFEEV